MDEFDIAIYHGNERWILRGLAIDLENSFTSIGLKVIRKEILFQKNDIGSPPNAKWHFFVHIGQMENILGKWKKYDLNSRSICIFTHYDRKNCNIKLLNSIHTVTYMSSHQMAIAMSVGVYNQNSLLLPLGVRIDRHFPLKGSSINTFIEKNYPKLSHLSKRSTIGFCTRYSQKPTYIRRKNYKLLLKLIQVLLDSGRDVIVIGDGWGSSKLAQHPKLYVIDPKYKEYNCFYNLMKIFVSVTTFDGGPIPLLESMASGVYPIVTNSGFAPDIIKTREHGMLMQPFSSINEIMKLINEAEFYIQNFQNQSKLRTRAEAFSFDAYASKLKQHLFRI